MHSFFSKKPKFDPAKVKANIRMAISRIRMQQNKLVNSVKIQRRHIAELLSLQKYDSARIKVEQSLRDDVSIEGFEVLTFFLELLVNRLQMIAECGARDGKDADNKPRCPPELKESVTSVLWASSRVGDIVPELQNIRNYFEHLFGKEFVAMSVNNSEFSVNQKLIDRLGIYTPSNERCVRYITMIAEEYTIEGYSESKLHDPNSMIPSVRAASGAAILPDPAVTTKCATFKTPSGLRIPALTTPRDELELRLLQLKRG